MENTNKEEMLNDFVNRHTKQVVMSRRDMNKKQEMQKKVDKPYTSNNPRLDKKDPLVEWLESQPGIKSVKTNDIGFITGVETGDNELLDTEVIEENSYTKYLPN